MNHSECGPSQLQKADLCAASPFEESRLTSSIEMDYSKDGTKQHKIMERLLNGEMTLPEVPDKYSVNVRSAVEMFLSCLQDTVLADGTTSLGGIWHAEMQLPCLSTSVFGKKDVGTIDFHVVYPEQKRIFMLDWKFGGAMVHHPKWNLQLQDYVSCLWDKYGYDYTVECTYIQPQARDKYDMQPWSFEPSDRDWIVRRIMKIREKVYGPDLEYCVGPACQFCKARMAGTCWAHHFWPSQFFAGSPVSEEEISKMDEARLSEVLDVVRCVSVEAKRITNSIRSRLREEEIALDHWKYDHGTNRITAKADYQGRITRPIKICRKMERTLANESKKE